MQLPQLTCVRLARTAALLVLTVGTCSGVPAATSAAAGETAPVPWSATAATNVRAALAGGLALGRAAVHHAPTVTTAQDTRRRELAARAVRVAAARASRVMQRAPFSERSHWAAMAAQRSVRRAQHARHEHAPPRALSDLEKALALPEPWRSLVRCESVRDRSWQLASSSHARGWFHFLPSTWRSLGLSGDPAAAPFDVQYAAARRLAARDGLRAWSCARILGIT